ncbi:hypothetical protein [Rickettsia endosymbiont of Ceutorhynchus obstrictus]|uniref:hypothetical protein n=1 Tax=Rickettsia endosymbiont of Ceutorhynchus obstrictus TaxID=3066249 RepID=UPI003132D07D
MAAAIQAIPNVMRDLIRILNKFSIKICLTGLPRRHKCLLAMTIPVAMQQRPKGGNPEKYLNELYSKFLYNFAYFKCFFWIPTFS